jgi:hypothetical protein
MEGGTYPKSPHIACVHCKLCLDLAHQLNFYTQCGLLQVATSLLLHQVNTLQLRVHNVLPMMLQSDKFDRPEPYINH